MPKPRFFFKNCHNQSSGGVKYIHHLVLLLREKGYEAYVVLPKLEPLYATWLENPAPAIHNEDMLHACTADDIVIDSWNDRSGIALTRKLPSKIKVMSWQASSFIKSRELIGDEFLKNDWGYTHFWTVSNASRKNLINRYPHIKRFYVIHHYFRFGLYQKYIKGTARRRQILALTRRGARYARFIKWMFGRRILFGRQIPVFLISRRFTEPEFYTWAAESRFFLHTAIGLEQTFKRRLGGQKIIYTTELPSEGFPFPPAEATIAGAVVIGFLKDGDWEWLDDSCAFAAKDRSYFSLFQAVKRALRTPETKLNQMQNSAFQNLQRFNKEHTWKELEKFFTDIRLSF